MMRHWLAAGMLTALAACGGEPPAPVAVTPPSLATGVAQVREVALDYAAEAVVEAVRQSTVSAQVAGRVMELRFDVGDTVKKGDVIVRIDERAANQAVLASAAQVQEAQASLANARAQFERSKQLAAQKFISAAGLEKAETDYRAAQARVASLIAGAGQASTERSFATIVAPYSGVVSARHVELGEMATPGKPLMTGFDPSTLRVVATVPQAQVAAIQSSNRAWVEVPAMGKRIEARSVTVVPSADPRTHTTKVRVNLPGDINGIYPGVFARAHFAVGRASRLMIPRFAVFHRSEVTAVYVVDDAGMPRLRQIRLGTAADAEGLEVLSGVVPGERVALEPVKAGLSASR